MLEQSRVITLSQLSIREALVGDMRVHKWGPALRHPGGLPEGRVTKLKLNKMPQWPKGL